MAMTSAEINETIRKAKAGTPLADTAPSADKVMLYQSFAGGGKTPEPKQPKQPKLRGIGLADKIAALDARIAVLEGGVV